MPNGEPNGQPNGQPNGMPNGEPNGQPNGQPDGIPNGDPNGDRNDQPNGESQDQTDDQWIHTNGVEQSECGCDHDGEHTGNCSHDSNRHLSPENADDLPCCYCQGETPDRSCQSDECDCVFHDNCLQNNRR